MSAPVRLPCRACGAPAGVPCEEDDPSWAHPERWADCSHLGQAPEAPIKKDKAA